MGRGSIRSRKVLPFLPGDVVEFFSSDGGGKWKSGVVVEWVVMPDSCGVRMYSGDDANKYGRGNVRIRVGDGVHVIRPTEKCRMSAKLPIDVIPGSSPTRFSWTQPIQDLAGERKVIRCDGALPPGVEKPVADLIALAKRLIDEKAVLQGTVRMAVDRLGGRVEGEPTHEGNLLQRVDELVAMEAKITTDKPQHVAAKKR